MKLSMVYVYPMVGDTKHYCYAVRFIDSYARHNPRFDHESIIVLNGGRVTNEVEGLFGSLPNVRYLERDDSGWDIGAYQAASANCDSDIILFFNTSVFINNDGWMLRMVNAVLRYGEAQYGTMGNRGNLSVGVWPHIRTTAFWMPPKLFNSYPKRIVNPNDRHPFEHGKDCFTGWVTKRGLKSWVITSSGDYSMANWNDDPNGYQRGNQKSLLVGDRMCERPYLHNNNRCQRDSQRSCSPWSTEECVYCLMR